MNDIKKDILTDTLIRAKIKVACLPSKSAQNKSDKIKFSKVKIITVAKVGSANFLNCKYSQLIYNKQNKDIFHGHNLLTLKNTLERDRNSLIIVGIRNPIDRNLSYLFQTSSNYYPNDVKMKKNNYRGQLAFIPGIFNKKQNSYNTPNKIIDLYFKNGYDYHNTFNDWFEEFLDITKINNFDRNKGIDFYKFPNNNTLMFYTLEKLNENEKYIKEQLGISSNIKNINDSNIRPWNKIYKEIKQKIVYKKEYLDNLLDTNIMRLFYSENDIKSFYSKYKTL